MPPEDLHAMLETEAEDCRIAGFHQKNKSKIRPFALPYCSSFCSFLLHILDCDQTSFARLIGVFFSIFYCSSDLSLINKTNYLIILRI